MSRKFIIGVELLTGLAIGAAASAAAVSFIIVFLVDRSLDSESGHMATVTAYSLCNSIDQYDSEEAFAKIAGPLVRTGSLESAVILDASGNVALEYGLSPDEIPVPGVSDDWHFAQISGSELLVGVKSGISSISTINKGLISGLAMITLALAVLAVFTPRYLSRTVISPLRDILFEADRFTSGGGSDPEAAGASFHRLVELLHERDDQLIELRQKAELRADRIEKRSAAILSVLGSAVFAVDGQGKLSLFNRQSGELFGLRDDDIGKEFPWERSAGGIKLRPVILSLGENGESLSEFTIREESGNTERMYSVALSRSRTDEIAVMVTDVTRISELERSIADQTAMADIGAASAGISHEMGNTLCALSGFVDLLARGHTDERTINILSEVRREVDSAQELISSFGNFARSPEPVKSDLMRKDIISICRKACEPADGRFSIKSTHDEFSINADRKLLASCVGNIVRNAVEADPSSVMDISISISGSDLLILISDNGPGISMSSEDVFRPFRSTKNRSSGNMGLGLSVSRRIIRSMGGELSAENRPEGGAQFSIQLPLSRSGGDS